VIFVKFLSFTQVLGSKAFFVITVLISQNKTTIRNHASGGMNVSDSKSPREEESRSLESAQVQAGTKQSRRVWRQGEDSKLCASVKRHEKFASDNMLKKSWQMIAREVPSRNAKQCRDRWTSMSSGLTKEPWAKEEDLRLERLQSSLGNSWVEISKSFPSRSDNSLKARFRLLQKREAQDMERDSSTDSAISGLESEISHKHQKTKSSQFPNPPLLSLSSGCQTSPPLQPEQATRNTSLGTMPIKAEEYLTPKEDDLQCPEALSDSDAIGNSINFADIFNSR